MPLPSRRPCTTSVVDVPIMVIVPPSIVIYDSGIKNLEGLKPLSTAQSLIIGVSATTIGVLLRKPDANPIGNVTLIILFLASFAFPSSLYTIISIIPCFCIAPATMNKSRTVSIPSLEKPFKACSLLITPLKRKITSARNIKKSARMTSNDRPINIRMIIIATKIISPVIQSPPLQWYSES